MEHKYSTYPSILIPFTNNSTLVNYNIRESNEIIEDRECKVYTCNYVIVDIIDKDHLVDAMIRAKYSLSQELAILRQKEEKIDEYNEYNIYAEQCKQIANSILNNEHI